MVTVRGRNSQVIRFSCIFPCPESCMRIEKRMHFAQKNLLKITDCIKIYGLNGLFFCF